MIKKLKELSIALVTAALLLLPGVLAPALVSAQSATCDPNSGSANVQGCLDAGACFSTNSTACPQAQDPAGKVNSIITTVVNVLSLIVGVVAVIMIIVGGLKYITSSGDSGNVTAAKNTIMYAIIGLVIVALAQIIVRFVLAKVSS